MSEKLSLHYADIVITYRAKTAERAENLYTTLAHFEYTYQDYRIFIVEADVEPQFDWNRFANPNVIHHFHYDDGPFQRSFLCNLGVKLASHEIVVIHDNDSIAQPWILSSVIDYLTRTKEATVKCPYWSVINVADEAKQAFMAKPDFAQFEGIGPKNLPEGYNVLYANAAGGINVWRREDYIRVGGMNSAFIGWGGEDNELLVRSSQLGMNWSSIDTPMFHLHHDSTSRKNFFLNDEAAIANMAKAEEMSQKNTPEENQKIAEQLRQFFN